MVGSNNMVRWMRKKPTHSQKMSHCGMSQSGHFFRLDKLSQQFQDSECHCSKMLGNYDEKYGKTVESHKINKNFTRLVIFRNNDFKNCAKCLDYCSFIDVKLFKIL